MAQEPTAEQGGATTNGEAVQAGGRWQIPLLGLSLICFAAALVFFVTRPRETRVDPAELAQLARTALAADEFVLADEECETFLKSFPSHELAAEVHEIQGDANFSRGLRAFENQQDYYNKAARAYRSANELRPGGLSSPTILLKLGRTHQKMEEPQLAIRCYDQALESAPADPLPIHMAKVEALRSLRDKPDLEGALAEIRKVRTKVADLDDDEKAVLALEEASILNEQGKHAEAEEKLRTLADQETKALRTDRFLIELAKTQMLAGKHTRALDTLQSIINVPGPHSPEAQACRSQAFLLHGRAYYQMRNYDKALEWFDRTANEYPGTPEALAARLGEAETYVVLGELDTASERYAAIAPALRKMHPSDNPWINLTAARQVLRLQSAESDLRGRHEEALRFVMLEEQILRNPDRDVRLRRAGILEKVAAAAAGEAERNQADQDLWHAKRLEAEKAWREAGDIYIYVAGEFDGRTQKEYPDDLWAATRCYLSAGAYKQASETLRMFIRDVHLDSRVPEAQLELARQYEVLGKPDEAITMLQELTRQHGNTLAGFEGAYLLGLALARKGPECYDQAEEAFVSLVENARIEPRSLWYRCSLLELGRLMHRRGQYDQAIIRLHEYIQRYPEDPDVLSAEYLLASSVRNQGLKALEQSREAVRLVDKEALRQMHRQKLQSAIRQFRELVVRYEQLSENMDDLRREEYRSVLFNLADSLYELGDIEESERHYNVIVYRFETSPCVMPAYVQLARIYQDQGRMDQYAAVLERARWTLEKIPTEAFAQQLGGPSKDYWESWIRTLQPG